MPDNKDCGGVERLVEVLGESVKEVVRVVERGFGGLELFGGVAGGGLGGGEEGLGAGGEGGCGFFFFFFFGGEVDGRHV